MERRYLVAALAIIATFAVFSRGFHSLQRMSLDQSQSFETVAAAKCWASSAAQQLQRVRAHLRHGYPPEQAQMVAEMNLPGMETSIAEQMARQDRALARCAREQALQQAERARHEALRMKEEYMRAYVRTVPARPMAIAVNLPADFEQRIQEQTARMVENQMQLQTAAEKLANVEIPSVDVDTQVSSSVVPNVRCKVKVSRQSMRDAVRGFQYGFTSK